MCPKNDYSSTMNDLLKQEGRQEVVVYPNIKLILRRSEEYIKGRIWLVIVSHG